jgi:hypothetical protein
MDRPEWLEGETPAIEAQDGNDGNHIPDWLREEMTEPSAKNKKPKKKLLYIAPSGRDSMDRSSFGGPFPDVSSAPTSFGNAGVSLSSSANHRNQNQINPASASTPFGPIAVFSPQHSLATRSSYQSISTEEDPEVAMNQKSNAPFPFKEMEDDEESHLSSSHKQASEEGQVDILLWWFRIFHLSAGLSAVICVAGNCFAVSQWHHCGARSTILHSYAAVFSMLIVAIECEVPFLIHRLKLLDWWVVRGLLYLFVGSLTIDPSDELEHQSQANINMTITQNIAGGVLSGVAVLYIVMGLLCMKQIRDKKLAHFPLLGSFEA